MGFVDEWFLIRRVVTAFVSGIDRSFDLFIYPSERISPSFLAPGKEKEAGFDDPPLKEWLNALSNTLLIQLTHVFLLNVDVATLGHAGLFS